MTTRTRILLALSQPLVALTLRLWFEHMIWWDRGWAIVAWQFRVNDQREVQS